MATRKTTLPYSWRLYSLGVMALGIACLVFGDFDPGQTVPKDFPARTPLAYAAGSLMIIAAAAIEWQQTALWGAGVLTGYYGLCVVLLMNGRLLLTEFGSYGTYENSAMQVAIAAGGLIISAAAACNDARMNAMLASRLTRIGQVAFGVCSLIWGGAHFVYMNLTAPLVPGWLPPGQVFWGYVTGACFIAAGVAILTRVQSRLAAILLSIMIASFGVLANGRMLIADPSSHWNWTESILNLALTGAACVVAGSMTPQRN
jgi:uncharacterized membrane protein